MALKTFTAGERLFAADLNDNFGHVEDATNILVPTTDDTGAPWNIPYIDGGAAGTLAAADEAQALAIAAGLDEAIIALGPNVVQAAKLDTFSTASPTFVTITGLEVTITPSVATHKVLLVATVNFSDSGTAAGTHFRFTGGNATDFVGDSAGSRTRSATGDDTNGTTSVNMPQRVIVYVDSPATTSPVTYGVQMLNTSSSSTFVNRSRDDSDSARRTRGASSIVAIEVAA